jgi:predicted kinase
MANGNFGDARPALILLSGLPGAGKTTFARALGERLPLVHVESDAIRRTMTPEPTYSFRESGAVFARVEAMARAALTQGEHALIDATNLTNRDRKRFLRLAQAMDARLIAVRLTAPDAVLRERVTGPREGHSQAGVPVLERMKGRPQPLPVPSIVVDTRYGLGPAIDLILKIVNDQEQ